MAAILSCIDSRAPVELLFDTGIGDIFTIRIGNVISHKVIGSIEYSCAVAGAKLVVVMGHTSCGAVRAAADFMVKDQTASESTGCSNLDSLIGEIQKSIHKKDLLNFNEWTPEKKNSYLDELAQANAMHSIAAIRRQSPILEEMVQQNKISFVGAMYNISSGEVDFPG